MAALAVPAAGKIVGSIFAKKAIDKLSGKKSAPAPVESAPKPIVAPDEETLKRNARRDAARRKSSRARTVLSGYDAPLGETLGP